ncbi:ankyrin repeat domain-containing protein 66-like [Convolutriloba macropyga]|uniref:ankyrin repeat domain-containing protein 66-like n=1 Tax=Convolutriloba macropyga TaxID=536237 RepID=UPI003F521427
MTELHEVVCQNDYDRLEDEVKRGKHDVNARDEEWGYRHALHWAAQKGFSECIRLLVEFGAWPYAKDYRGWTAGHYAAEAGKLPVCRTLMAVKCPLDHKDKWGMTPYDVALVYGHKECAAFLLQAMEEINELRNKFNNDKNSSQQQQQKEQQPEQEQPQQSQPTTTTGKSRHRKQTVVTLPDDVRESVEQLQQETSSQLDDSSNSSDEVFEYDRDDPNWTTFFNLEWGNPEFEGIESNVYIPYLMTGA